MLVGHYMQQIEVFLNSFPCFSALKSCGAVVLINLDQFLLQVLGDSSIVSIICDRDIVLWARREHIPSYCHVLYSSLGPNASVSEIIF